MACCSVDGQKYWLAGCTTFTFLLALIIGLLWPTFALRTLLYPQLVLKEGSTNFENWKETPIPIYFHIYMFNWTNHDEVHDLTTKPHFNEMGPYVFRLVSNYAVPVNLILFFYFLAKNISEQTSHGTTTERSLFIKSEFGILRRKCQTDR